MKSFLFGLTAIAGLVSSASAAEIYVATYGNDVSGDGSVTNPFKTISHAAAVAAPGTTVYVRGGVYTGYVRMEKKENEGPPRTVYTSYPGETAIIDGTGGARWIELVRISGSNVDFKNFEVRNSADIGIAIYNAHDDVISHCVVHDSWQAAIQVESDNLGQAHDNAIDSNTAYNNGLVNSRRKMNGGWPGVIQTADSDRTTIGNNTVYRNYGEGLSVLRSRDARVAGNTAYDNYSMNVYLDNAPGAIVEGNFLYATGDSRFFIRKKRVIGIGAALENYSSDNLPLTNIIVRNNIAYATRYGFYYGAYDRPDGMQNSLVAENTFVNATDADIHIDYSSGSSGNALYGNIAYKVGGILVEGNQTGWIFTFNCLYNGTYSGFLGIGNLSKDPQLVGGDLLSPDSYKIQPRSPCASYVPLLSQVPTDFWGTTRVSPTSAGAYQPTPSGASVTFSSPKASRPSPRKRP